MTDLAQVAQSLIVRLNAPAQYHSVWIRTETNPEGKFVKHLCVSVRPGCEAKVNVPKEHMGVPIVNVSWPEGAL